MPRPTAHTIPADQPGDAAGTEVPTAVHAVAGTHCLLELSGCPDAVLNDESVIRRAIRDAAQAAGSTLLQVTSHAFSPCGVTALGLLAESHISVHTWPETGYAAVDIFTCGTQCRPHDACTLLARSLGAGHTHLRTYERGSNIPESHTNRSDI